MSDLYRNGENHTADGWYLKGGDTEMFLTKHGGQHAPVTFFADSDAPVQPYYINDWQERHPDLSSIPLLKYLRGDFFCLPFGGNGDPVDGKQFQCHGETSAKDWSFASAEKVGARSIYEFTMDTQIVPFHVVKHIEMRDGESALYIRHTVTGLDGKMPYGHHTILRMPEANEKMYFSCGRFDLGMVPETTFSDPANWEYQFLQPGATFDAVEAIPTIYKKPAVYDYSTYPSPVGYADLFALLKKPAATPAWAVAAYPDNGYLYYSLKNAGELPSTTIWVSNSGRYEEPWNGTARCFAIEETCSCFADGWKPSIEENPLTRRGWKTCGDFSGDKPFSVRHVQGVVRIPATFGKVRKADFAEGRVTFKDEAGQSAVAAVDWRYLL